MKFHRTLLSGVAQALESIFQEQQVASRVIKKLAAQNPKWGKRDRAFVAETTYEIVRWRRLLEHAAQSGESRFLVTAQIVKSGKELPGFAGFSGIDADSIRARLEQSEISRAIPESIPDWLDAFGQSELGERWDAEIVALNREAPVVLRANTLKITRDNLKNRLHEANIGTQTIADLPDALQLETRRSIAHL